MLSKGAVELSDPRPFQRYITRYQKKIFCEKFVLSVNQKVWLNNYFELW